MNYKNVAHTRIKSLNPLVITAHCTNNDDVSLPYLFAPPHQPTTIAPSGAVPPQKAPARRPGITDIVMEAFFLFVKDVMKTLSSG